MLGDLISYGMIILGSALFFTNSMKISSYKPNPPDTQYALTIKSGMIDAGKPLEDFAFIDELSELKKIEIEEYIESSQSGYLMSLDQSKGIVYVSLNNSEEEGLHLSLLRNRGTEGSVENYTEFLRNQMSRLPDGVNVLLLNEENPSKVLMHFKDGEIKWNVFDTKEEI